MCKNCMGDLVKTKTVHAVDYNGFIIVIKNVPCLECPICGEIIYDSNVSALLTKTIDNVKEAADISKQEFTLIDYNKIAS